MNKLTISLLSASLLCSASLAQGPNFLLSYSQQEQSLSGSGGTVLGNLLPNEINYLDFTAGPCPGASAEKWLPRTASNVMLGDENGDGLIFNPGIYGNIDAVHANAVFSSPIGLENQRTVYHSVTAPIGPAVSLNPFRPGDVARVVRQGFVDGQVEFFCRQEMFNQSLGLPPAYGIDIDAVAHQPNFGLFFSVDIDVPAVTACGPMLVQDGDVLCVPPWALTYTADMRIAGIAPNSAVVVHSEAQMDVFTWNAQVTDRFGACVPNVLDVESLEIDLFGPVTTTVPCPGFTLTVPALIFSGETFTGASLLTTQFGGQIYNTPCGPAARNCGFGPTFGPQMGIQSPSTTVGAASYIDGISFGRVCRHVLEPQQHVMTCPTGCPATANSIDWGSEFGLNLVLVEIMPPGTPPSLPAFPFSQFCFPDLYAPSIFPHVPAIGPWGSFSMLPVPPAWTGRVLFQSVGFASTTLELSTPTIIDVN